MENFISLDFNFAFVGADHWALKGCDEKKCLLLLGVSGNKVNS